MLSIRAIRFPTLYFLLYVSPLMRFLCVFLRVLFFMVFWRTLILRFPNDCVICWLCSVFLVIMIVVFLYACFSGFLFPANVHNRFSRIYYVLHLFFEEYCSLFPCSQYSCLLKLLLHCGDFCRAVGFHSVCHFFLVRALLAVVFHLTWHVHTPCCPI